MKRIEVELATWLNLGFCRWLGSVGWVTASPPVRCLMGFIQALRGRLGGQRFLPSALFSARKQP